MKDQKLNSNQIFGDVRLSRLDETALKEAKEWIEAPLGFAAEVINFTDVHRIAGLADAILAEMVAETAPKGVAVEKLCHQAKTSDGHVREYFDQELRDLVDIAIRVLLLMTSRSALHQYIRSQPVRVGRDSHALGVDHEKGAPHVAQLLVCTLSCCDRNLINQADWLVTDTHDDRTSGRADLERIENFERNLGHRLSGATEEHIQNLFAAEQRSLDLVTEAASSRGNIFLRFGISARILLRYCFPRCLILDRMSVGRPQAQPLRDFTRELFPGDDEAVISAVERAGRYGIARCRLAETSARVPYGALEDQLLGPLGERLGERPIPISPSRLGEVAGMERAQLAGVGANIRQVRIWHFPKSERMLRAMQASDSGGEYIDADLWRTIRLSDRNSQRIAVALLERSQQVWPRTCIDRYRKEFEPGRVQASSARARAGLMQTSLVASAAGVSAHRNMEIRELAE